MLAQHVCVEDSNATAAGGAFKLKTPSKSNSQIVQPTGAPRCNLTPWPMRRQWHQHSAPGVGAGTSTGIGNSNGTTSSAGTNTRTNTSTGTSTSNGLVPHSDTTTEHLALSPWQLSAALLPLTQTSFAPSTDNR